MARKSLFLSAVVSLVIIMSVFPAIAEYYAAEVYFTVPDTVFTTNERIELKGIVYLANFTANGTTTSSRAPRANATVNFTIRNVSNFWIANYTFTADNNGTFYSRSNFYTSAQSITAPNSSGAYILRAQFTDAGNATKNGTIWYSELGIRVINASVDTIRISSEKAAYNPSDTIIVTAEAVKTVGDRVLATSNVTINGSLRNASKAILHSFNCTTTSSGKCSVSLTGPSTYGTYLLEADDFKDFSSFSVVPFSYNVYMKDDLGNSLKNVYAQGEQATIEVSIANASTSDAYNFSGYILDSSGNTVKIVNGTTLNSNNTFTNTFLFTVDAITFPYGTYRIIVPITKSGGGSITAYSSFEVKDWTFTINKKSSNSGFEYEHSVFANKVMKFELLPTYRVNGSVLANLNTTVFTIALKDNLDNDLSTAAAQWNSSCGNSGCYEFSLTSPSTAGSYTVSATISHNGITQTKSKVVNVVNGIISVQSSNSEGALKELFGTSEYVYLSLNAYNSSTPQFNLSEAEVFVVRYMNGTEINYTQVLNWTAVNTTTAQYDWAFNVSTQRLKIDAPRAGGVYSVFVFGNNRSIGALGRFIINPYEVCSVPKDTAGQVSNGNYYIWQFKKKDTVYFEIKLIQANNPLGRASASNFTTGNSSSTTGKGTACSIDSSTQQAVTNATITITDVKNVESGTVQGINTTGSTCQATDSSGTYTCTLQPSGNWEGGANVVAFRVTGQDGTSDVAYSSFEARSFYISGWSSNWQNGIDTNITLNLNLYEAGSGWWGSSGGLSGTVTVKRVEYMGREGEWIWPPVDSLYNVSNVSSSTITSGSGSISIPTSGLPSGQWKTGNYRVVLAASTASGDTDYGYAWFGIKRWDVYGQPIECIAGRCDYKNYFNSKDNITMYIKISGAGAYNYNDQGGSAIGGNVSIKVKKIQDCRSWPCKELNTSSYNASILVLNESSKWYWNANASSSHKYIMTINSTAGGWGTGYYSVLLDVNGTDTGSAWFNTISFYVDPRPTDKSGNNYQYSIKPRESIYFNTSITKGFKGWNSAYTGSDYLNATVNDTVLRGWSEETSQTREYNYPEDLNISIVNVTGSTIRGNALMNLSYKNGSWPTGYYSGEITFMNTLDNETSRSWLWFQVQPFRVTLSANNYNVDSDQCVNSSIGIYEPSWYSNTFANGSYTIASAYENVWGNSGSTRTSYTNYTTAAFNASSSIVVCPGSSGWSSGSWGGYHYLNTVIRNSAGENQTGWLSFRSLPFSIGWGGVGGGTNKLLADSIVIRANVSKPLTGLATSGNITKISQWRSDANYNGEESYVFSVGTCYSNVSGQCTVNGTQNVTIYAPSHGWKSGYNYLTAYWTKDTDSSSRVDDWGGISFQGLEAYNGYFSNSDLNGWYKDAFSLTENFTIKLNARDTNYNSVNVNISNIQYAFAGNNCWSEWCLSYTSATYAVAGGGIQTSSGNAIITIKAPSSGWESGRYYIKASVSGSAGSATITGGQVRARSDIKPNITISSPVNNQTITNTTFSFSATTTKNTECSMNAINYNNFHSWYCGGWISNSSSNVTSQKKGACNATSFGGTQYNYTGNKYWTTYVSKNYFSTDNSTKYSYSDAATGLSTGGTTHTYTMNVSNWTAQYYGVILWCYDSDYNSVNELVSFKVNVSGT